MDVTSFGHSCLLVEDGDARLLIDPGTYSHGFEDLSGLTGVLVTHQHPDHLDPDRFGDVLANNPGVQVFTDPQTRAQLDQRGIRVQAVAAGDALADMGTSVTVHGGQHAVIHRDIPVVDNVGYLIGGRLFHPGDALFVPEVDVEILAVPAAAPWLALKEAIDYQRTIAPRYSLPIHTAVLSEGGLGLHMRLLDGLAPEDTTVYANPPGSKHSF